MPLPAEALTVKGGCNCRNILYRIKIPPLKSRPFHPRYAPSSGLGPVYQPYIFYDHCNDCRRATGSVLPAWISGLLECVEISLPTDILQRTYSREEGGPVEEYRQWLPSEEVITGSNELAQGKLSIYSSSPGRYRSFCTVCGTNLFYWEEQLPEMVDVVLGTVDREYLETEYLRPERHLWWDLSLPWIRETMEEGDGGQLDKHIGADMNKRETPPEPISEDM